MSVMSMTGRGNGRAGDRTVRVEVEIGSVNRKQLDVALGLPRRLSPLESRIQACIRQRVSRGRITGEIRVEWSAAAQAAAVRVDEAAARARIAALRAVAKKLGLPDDLRASALLAMPDLVAMDGSTGDADALWPLVQKALNAALDGLCAMRRREGAVLARDLRTQLKILAGGIRAIAARAPKVVDVYRAALHRRLAEAWPGQDLASDERLIKELALFADRADIREELVRLDSHVRQAADLLQAGGEVGRPLDFLVQEMGREINTIGAKANDLEITRRVIASKTALERIREQAQNIE